MTLITAQHTVAMPLDRRGAVDPERYDTGRMISVDEARAAVLGRVPLLSTERVPLNAALSRVLRAPAAADRDQPPFHRAAMDVCLVLLWRNHVLDKIWMSQYQFLHRNEKHL
ncbi:MAG: hypothetical protein ABI565_02705 [Vicinamibacteria bacterium]